MVETSWWRPVGVVLPQGGSPDIPVQVEHMHKAGHAIRQRVAGYSPSVEAARKWRSDGQTSGPGDREGHTPTSSGTRA